MFLTNEEMIEIKLMGLNIHDKFIYQNGIVYLYINGDYRRYATWDEKTCKLERLKNE